MAVQRESILELIGSRRYHSAILTTFSFDFYFFEMKAMRWLRSCGIRNVNVLIDGHYYSELMKQSSGEEMNLTPGYSLYPVFQKSIFHPKLWMLFGEKGGLLIIGSGNLTNAGNGNNEEIWGAFHFEIQHTENSTLFASAWQYLQGLCSNTKGLINEKTTRWIPDHSKWVKELLSQQASTFHKVQGKDMVAFLTNSNDNTIWKQLTSIIANEKIVEITILSPYYDTDGKVIQSIASMFPSAKIKIVIDQSGSIPVSLSVVKEFTFYDWYSLGISKPLHTKTEELISNSKLHAKIIHFKTNSDKEFCLFGSANATPEGMGLEGAKANSEASILIRSESGGLLSRLGIKLKEPTTLSAFTTKHKTTIYDSIIKNNSYKIKLSSVEWLHDELHLYAQGAYSNNVVIKMFDKENRVFHSIKLGEFKTEMRVKHSCLIDGIHNVELFDQESDESISNKILLTNYSLLIRTHPNPKSGDFEEILNELHAGGELTKVLDLLHYALIDDSESESNLTVLAGKGVEIRKAEDKHEPDKLYDLSTYKAVGHQSLEKSLLITSLSLRILDVLKFIKTNEFSISTKLELRVDEQEDDLAAIIGIDESEILENRNNSLANLKTEKRKLLNYFESLYQHQQNLLYDNKKPINYRPSLSDLTRYLISLELILEFGGKPEKYTENNKERVFTFLDLSGEAPYFNDNVKGCCLNLIGDFLMLIRSGYKQYDFDYTRQKMELLKFEALVSSIVSLLNIKWKENEYSYLNTLLLNCLHYLGEKSADEFDDLLPLLNKSISEKISTLKYPLATINDNRNWFENRIIPAFKKTIIHLSDKKFESSAERGQIIYKSPWGYCWVKDVSLKNEFTLVRPGFMWDEKSAEFIKHTNDDVYRPIHLPSFIILNL